MSDSAVYTQEQRALDGKISELEHLLSQIRATTTANHEGAFPFSHQRDLHRLYGSLLAIAWSQPETIARLLWRQNETERGALRP